MTPSAPRVRGARLCSAFLLSLFTILGLPRLVQAERVLVKGDNWEVFTDGRVGAFASWVYGDPMPVATAPVTLSGGGWSLPTEPHADDSRGTVNMMRIRTGFIGNLLGIGVRNQLTPWTTLSGYIQIWAYIESDDRNKSNPN